MNPEVFNVIQIEGLGDETEEYRNLTGNIVNGACEIIERHSISYDFGRLENRIASLKIVRRDGIAHEWSADENTLYVSKCNQDGEPYSDEEMIIFATHELMHFVSEPDGYDEFGDKYFGFNEFFTEYLSFLVVSKIGGINLESHYKHNSKGYFGDGRDFDFMKKLTDRISIGQLLDVYLGRKIDEVESVVGADALEAMNSYYDYNCQLYDAIGVPLKRFNEIMTNPLFAPQRQIIDDYVDAINNSI